MQTTKNYHKIPILLRNSYAKPESLTMEFIRNFTVGMYSYLCDTLHPNNMKIETIYEDDFSHM